MDSGLPKMIKQLGTVGAEALYLGLNINLVLERSFVAQLKCAILWKDILKINTVNLKVSIRTTHETLHNNGLLG